MPMKSARRRQILVYGNCQAEAMAMAMQAEPPLSSSFTISYLRNDPPSEEEAKKLAPLLSKCCLLFEQRDPVEFSYRDLLPPECATVTFAPLEFGLLWPFNRPNPYDRIEAGEQFPRFPYGDRVIVDLLDRGLAPDDILRHYLDSWDAYGPPLEILYDYENHRLKKVEADCDVKMADDIAARFRDEQLFWTFSHPSGTLLRELYRRLIEGANAASPAFAKAMSEATTVFQNGRFPEVLEPFEVPVHPAIAEHFKLRWYDSRKSYKANEVVHPSYEDYFRSMIEHSVATGRTEPKENGSPARASGPLESLIVAGNAQANAVALILRHIPAIAERYEVAYEDAPPAAGAVLCIQGEAEVPAFGEGRSKPRIIRFPNLKFEALWPFHRVNPFDRKEPPDYPHGRFPYGDSFIASCVENDVPQHEIMHFVLAPDWNPSWPGIGDLLAAETKRLQTEDAANDVKIGDCILDRFRTERLFWTVDAPTNVLLSEVVIRLLDVLLDDPPERAETLKIFFDTASQEFFGSYAVPIHPYVARHLGLTWYRAGERYRHFGDAPMSYGKYFEAMIERAYAVKNDRSQHST
jgi:hypothetical protein